EPEAPSSVWNHVQQSITSPAAPAAATQVITAKLGWIAAAVLTTGIAITLFVAKPWNHKNNTQTSPVESQKSVITTSTPSTSKPSGKEAIMPYVTPSVSPDGYTPSENKKVDNQDLTSDKSISTSATSSNTNVVVNTSSTNQITVSNNILSNNTAVVTNTVVSTVNNSNNSASISNIKNQEPALLIANAKTGFAPLSVTFVVNTGVSTDINFGDGSTAFKTSSITHKFTKSGNYEVKCLLNDKETVIKITVLNDLGSAFSPNGDGVNDNFIFGGDNINDLNVNVYDRTGKRVYAGNTNNCMWDGILNDGQKAETGTYFYDIFATTVDGESFKQKGSINLFR
ncbi:MAG: gliding motility-associated C-terminal domain-containing protein, partial [Bacteroidota bacterium]